MNIPIYCVCDSLACVLIHAVNKVMSKQTDSCVHVYAIRQPFIINYNVLCSKYSSRLRRDVFNCVSKNAVIIRCI